MKGIEESARFLSEYSGPPVSVMEVCGTHTAALFKSGIRGLLSKHIRLVSGPGCPVCVTQPAYVDRLIQYAMTPGCRVLSFGDMLKVPGAGGSLIGSRGAGARFEMIYSPLQALEYAKNNPDTQYVVAAVGFETTAPAYALLLREAERRNLGNIRLLTALKTILPAMETICATEPQIDAFICPGHVSSVIGAGAYRQLSAQYRKPMCVAGFDGEHLLAALHALVTDVNQSRPGVRNLYPEAVSEEGNQKAKALLSRYFEPGDAVWRGIGSIPGSGLYLREAFAGFDAGSRALPDAAPEPAGCRCADVIRGRLDPADCPLFGKACRPEAPVGACMVSDEGACSVWYRNSEVRSQNRD